MKSSIDWLVEQVNADCTNSTFIRPGLIAKAREMQNRLIIKANFDGYVEGKEDPEEPIAPYDYCARLLELDTVEGEPIKVTENTSDGYHTFKELYEFRKVYNAALFNEWAMQGKYHVHKSMKHSDGELCFGGGWFIVVAMLPAGQISNHYKMEDWDMFRIPELEKAFSFDGHTSQDVIDRLKRLP